MTLDRLTLPLAAAVGALISQSPKHGINWLNVLGIVSLIFSVAGAVPVILAAVIVIRGRRRRTAAGFDRKSELRIDVIRSNERNVQVFPDAGFPPEARGQWGTQHPRGPRTPRPTTGIGQVRGVLSCGRLVGALYGRKRVEVVVSPEDPLSAMANRTAVSPVDAHTRSYRFDFQGHEHVILGGIERNTAALRFVQELVNHFGAGVILWRDEPKQTDTDNTIDVGIPWVSRTKPRGFRRRALRPIKSYDVIDGYLGPKERPPTTDYGLVVFWRNPDLPDDFRRTILCVGGSSYGTGDCSRFVFETLLLGSADSGLQLVQTTKRTVKRILAELRRHESCVFLLLSFGYGDPNQFAEPWTGNAKTATVVAFAALDAQKDRGRCQDRAEAPYNSNRWTRVRAILAQVFDKVRPRRDTSAPVHRP